MKKVEEAVFHEGRWKILHAEPNDLLAWSWSLGSRTVLVVINYSAHPKRGKVQDGVRLEMKPWESRFLERKQ